MVSPSAFQYILAGLGKGVGLDVEADLACAHVQATVFLGLPVDGDKGGVGIAGYGRRGIGFGPA